MFLQDATWLYRYFGSKKAWLSAGGDFDDDASATGLAGAEGNLILFEGKRESIVFVICAALTLRQVDNHP